MSDIEPFKKLLENGKPWEKRKIKSIPGASVVKIPGSRNRPDRLGVEFIPVDENGKPRKRKGLFISNYEDFKAYLEMLSNSKTEMLLRTIEEINNEIEKKADEETEEIDIDF